MVKLFFLVLFAVYPARVYCAPKSGDKNVISKTGSARLLKFKRRYCKFPGCSNVVKSQGLCQRHGAKVQRCRVDGCSKQSQGGHNGMCKMHFNAGKSFEEINDNDEIYEDMEQTPVCRKCNDQRIVEYGSIEKSLESEVDLDATQDPDDGPIAEDYFSGPPIVGFFPFNFFPIEFSFNSNATCEAHMIGDYENP